MNVKVGRYTTMKNGKTVLITKIMEKGICMGTEVSNPVSPAVTISIDDI